METLGDSPLTAAPASTASIEAWRAARADYAAADRRMWQSSLVLGPLSFAGLALLARTQCPGPMDFAALGGGSAAMLLLWLYQGERCQVTRERAAEELRAAETAANMRSMAIEGGSPDRMVRVILSAFFVVLWAWSWSVRPDCTVPPDEESDLTTYVEPL